MAEALVSNGLAKVIRYKQDDDQRSSKYDDLLAAEARAQKKGAGIHSTKEYTNMKIADASAVRILINMVSFKLKLMLNHFEGC